MTTRRSFLKSGIGLTGLALAGNACAAKPFTQSIPAKYWHAGGDKEVECELCPRRCIIVDGNKGICRTRENRDGALYFNGYANPCAMHVDPIEKKPFYHVLPGARAYSLAVAGCMFRCKNCQNYTISQADPMKTNNENLPPARVVEQAIAAGCTSIAYTYSEPTVWFEYMYDTAKLARKAGLKNVVVTCGYINPDPLRDLCQYIDAANVDLKSFDDTTYQNLNAGHLQPVLDAITIMKKNGVWVEIGLLVVPGWSDNMDQIRNMCSWVHESFGPSVPLHFLRFFPMYQLTNVMPTPRETLEQACAVAREIGMEFAYSGNVAELDSNTCCPKCKKTIITRNGYIVTALKVKKGKCDFCGGAIAGIWS
jgi:pyruvate formate lyase activating enzyme